MKATCPCRNVKERDVKEVIVNAFNQLPRERDRLIREQGALRDGELKRIDLEIERNRERQKRIAEELAEVSTDFLKDELEQAEYEETELILERAEAANKEMRIRLLLELLDTHSHGEKEWEDPACYDYEEFFERTRYVPDKSVMNDGVVKSFDNDMAARYLEKVFVREDGYDVMFKAGICVRV